MRHGTALRGLATAAVVLAGLVAGLQPGLAHSDGSGGVTVTVTAFVPATLQVTLAVDPADLDAEGRVPLGTRFRVTAGVANAGPAQLKKGEVTLAVDLSGLSFLGQQRRNFGALNAGQTKQARWNLVADEAGIYVLMADVSAIRSADGTPVTALASVTIVVAAPAIPDETATPEAAGDG